jgi:DNA-binding response OmpR family regulator
MSNENPPHVLVVDDDPAIRTLIEEYLRENDLRVTAASNGKEMTAALKDHAIDLIILDLRMPGEDGMQIARRVRDQSSLPIIVVSGRLDEADRVMALELGADDYVTKPFSPRELMARVQAALRRPQKQAPPANTFSFGQCEVDFAKMSARRAGKPITLTAHEFKLLKYFVENAERVLGREELLNEVWGYNSYPTTRTVDNQILKLRQKLEPDAADPQHLQTVYGAGYRFVP